MTGHPRQSFYLRPALRHNKRRCPQIDFEAFHVQTAVLGSGRDQQTLRGDRFPAIQIDNRVAVLKRHAGCRAGNGEVSPELIGLQCGAIGQFRTGEAGGEAEVVFDAHAAACLSAWGNRLQHCRAQTFGGAVDSGGQACRVRHRPPANRIRSGPAADELRSDRRAPGWRDCATAACVRRLQPVCRPP